MLWCVYVSACLCVSCLLVPGDACVAMSLLSPCLAAVMEASIHTPLKKDAIIHRRGTIHCTQTVALSWCLLTLDTLKKHIDTPKKYMDEPSKHQQFCSHELTYSLLRITQAREAAGLVQVSLGSGGGVGGAGQEPETFMSLWCLCGVSMVSLWCLYDVSNIAICTRVCGGREE